MKKLKSSLANMAIVLTLVSVIAGGLLAYINNVTKTQIEKINAENLQAGIKNVIVGEQGADLQVTSTDTVNVDGVDMVVYTTDKGTAVKSEENGFGGKLEVLVGFNADGDILGYTILSTQETPGLGVKAGEWFQKEGKGSIIGMNPDKNNMTVDKDGGEVHAITASTITSRAFLRAVAKAYSAFKNQSCDGKSGASCVKGGDATATENV